MNTMQNTYDNGAAISNSAIILATIEQDQLSSDNIGIQGYDSSPEVIAEGIALSRKMNDIFIKILDKIGK